MATQKKKQPAGVLKEGKIVYLDANLIKLLPGRNTRFDLGDMEELKRQIIELNGVREPIKVQLLEDDTFACVNGHRRVTAVQELSKNGLNFPIPAIQIPLDYSEEQICIEMLITNEGKPFLPLEEAMMIQRIKDLGHDHQTISKMLGKSISHVSNRLALLNADDSVKDAVIEGTITPSDAVTLVRKSHGNKRVQAEQIERVKQEGSSTVIEKELKAGRLTAVQWEASADIYDKLYSILAADEDGIQEGVRKGEEILRDGNFVSNLSNKDFYNFIMGMFFGAAQLANLTPIQFYEKLKNK